MKRTKFYNSDIYPYLRLDLPGTQKRWIGRILIREYSWDQHWRRDVTEAGFEQRKKLSYDVVQRKTSANPWGDFSLGCSWVRARSLYPIQINHWIRTDFEGEVISGEAIFLRQGIPLIECYFRPFSQWLCSYLFWLDFIRAISPLDVHWEWK